MLLICINNNVLNKKQRKANLNVFDFFCHLNHSSPFFIFMSNIIIIIQCHSVNFGKHKEQIIVILIHFTNKVILVV